MSSGTVSRCAARSSRHDVPHAAGASSIVSTTRVISWHAHEVLRGAGREHVLVICTMDRAGHGMRFTPRRNAVGARLNSIVRASEGPWCREGDAQGDARVASYESSRRNSGRHRSAPSPSLRCIIAMQYYLSRIRSGLTPISSCNIPRCRARVAPRATAAPHWKRERLPVAPQRRASTSDAIAAQVA